MHAPETIHAPEHVSLRCPREFTNGHARGCPAHAGVCDAYPAGPATAGRYGLSSHAWHLCSLVTGVCASGTSVRDAPLCVDVHSASDRLCVCAGRGGANKSVCWCVASTRAHACFRGISCVCLKHVDKSPSTQHGTQHPGETEEMPRAGWMGIVRSLQTDRTNRRRMYRRVIIRNWLVRWWRLTSPKSSSWDTGGPTEFVA